MRHMYAMRQPNGNWFAMNRNGHLHVPVFRNRSAAFRAQARDSGMMLFWPAVLDEQTLKDLAPADEACAVSFWLVDNGLADPSRGYSLEHAQLALLILDSTEQAQERWCGGVR